MVAGQHPPDHAAPGPDSLGAAAAPWPLEHQEEQAGPVPPAQDVRAGLREGKVIKTIYIKGLS